MLVSESGTLRSKPLTQRSALSAQRFIRPILYVGVFFVIGFIIYFAPALARNSSGQASNLAFLPKIESAQAATCVSAGSTDWKLDATWTTCNEGGGTPWPIAGDIVQIGNHNVVVATADGTMPTVASITFTSTGTLAIQSGAQINVTNAITLNSTAGTATTATISGAGTITAASMSVGTAVTPSGSNVVATLTSTITTITISGNVTLTGSFSNPRHNDATLALQSGVLTAASIVTAGTANSSVVDTVTMATGAQTGTLKLTAATTAWTIGATLTTTTSLQGTGNTVEYTGATPAIRVTPYFNLTLSGSGTATGAVTSVTGTLTMSGGAIWSADVISSTIAAVTLSGASTNLTSGANMTISGALTINSSATYTAGASRTLSVTGLTDVFGTITFPNTAALKTFTGGLTIESGGAYANAGNSTLSFAAALTNNKGSSISMGTGTATFTATGSNIAGNSDISFGGAVTINASTTTTNINTGVVTIATTLTLTTSNGNWTQGANSTVSFTQQNPFSGTGTFDASTNTNTVIYTASAATVKVVSYSSLTLSGGGTATGAVTTITGTLSMSSTTVWAQDAITSTMAAITLTGTASLTLAASGTVSGVVNIGNGTTLTVGANTLTLSSTGTPLVIGGTGTFTTTSSTVNYTGNGATLTPATYVTLGLKPSGSTEQVFSSGTYAITTLNVGDGSHAGASAVANTPTITVSGTMTVNAGAIMKLAAGGVINSVAGSSILTGSGTVEVNKNATNAFGTQYVFNTYTLTSLTVDYKGGASQLISNKTYGNLTISGTVNASGTQDAAVGGVMSVTGTFTPSAGTITMNTGSSISNSGTLTFQSIAITAAATVTTTASFSFAGTFTNNSTASFTASSASVITSTGGTISNGGTLLSFYDLTIGTGTTTANTDFTVSHVLTVTGTLSPTSGTITLSGVGTPLSIGGTFSPSGSNTVTYTGATATNITAGTYFNLTINPSGSGITDTFLGGTFTINGNLFIGGGIAQTAEVNTNDPIVDVNGNVTINGGGATLSASNSAAFTVAGNWDQSGVFTANGGTVTFDSTTSGKTIGGGGLNGFANVTLNGSGGVWTLTHSMSATGSFNITAGTFDQGASYNLSSGAVTVGASGIWTDTGTGSITLSGGVSNAGVITIEANGHNSCGTAGTDDITVTTSDGTTDRAWSGAGTFNIWDVNAIHQTGAGVTANSSTQGTGSTWTFVGCGVTISGIIYQNDGTTVLDCSTGGNRTVHIKVNGAGSYTNDCSGSGGTFSVVNVTVATDDVVSVFLFGETEKAITVTKAKDASTNITDMYLYQNRVTIRTETGAAAMTNSTTKSMGTYDGDDDATNILYTANSNNLSVSSGSMLLLFDNATTATSYTPGGTITTHASTDGTDSVVDGDVTIQSGATLTMGSNAMSIGGDYLNSGTISTSSGSTTTFTATSTGFTISNSAGLFDNVIFNGSGGEWTLSTDLTINGNVTITAGTFKISSHQINVPVAKVFSIGASGAFDNGSGALVIHGVGTGASRPFINAGTYTASTGNVQYGGDGDTTIETTGTSYYTLAVIVTTTTNRTFTPNGALTVGAGGLTLINLIGSGNVKLLLGGTTTISGTLGISTLVSGTATLDTGSNYSLTAGIINIDEASSLVANGSTITITSTGTAFVNSGTFTPGTSTFVYAGTGATYITATTYNNLSLLPASGSPTYTLGTASSQTITAKNLTIGDGSHAMTATAATYNPAINVSGDLTINSPVTYTKGSGIFTFNTATAFGNQNWTDNNSPTQNLGSVQLSQASFATLTITTSVRATTVNLVTGSLYDAGTNTFTITGTGTGGSKPLNASFSGCNAGSFVEYVGDGNTEVVQPGCGILIDPTLTASRVYTPPASFTPSTLNINPAAGSAYNLSFTLAGGLTGAGASLTLAPTGSATVTFDTGTNYAVTRGTITIGSAATFNANGSTITLTGSGTPFSCTSGTFTGATSTIIYTGTSATTVATCTGQNNLTINAASGNPNFTLAADFSFLGNITVTAGTLKVDTHAMTLFTAGKVLSVGASGTLDNGSGTITVIASGTGGSRPFVNAGTFTAGTGTFIYNAAADTSIETTNVSYYNLTLNPFVVGVLPIYTANGALTVTHNLNITPTGIIVPGQVSLYLGGNATITGALTMTGDSYATAKLYTINNAYSLTAASISMDSHSEFHATGSTITVTGSGTPFTNSGTFDAATSTFVYNSTSATNITATTYNNLSLLPAGTPTYTLGTASSQTINVKNLTLGDGSNAVTLTAATYNPAINVTGNLTFAASAVYTNGSGLTTFKAGTTQTVDASGGSLGAVQISANSGATTVNIASYMGVSTIIIDSAQTLNSNGTHTLQISGTGTAGSRPFINNGIFTQSTGSVNYSGDGDTTIETTNVTYYSLTLSSFLTASRVYTPNGPLTVTGNLSLTAAAITTTKNLTLMLGGTSSIGGTLIMSSGSTGVPIFDTGSNYSVSFGGILMFSSTIFNANGSTITLTGSGTAFNTGGTFNAGTSTVIYAGTSATAVSALTYNNLSLTPAGTPTYTLGGGTLAVKNFTIGDGSNAVTVDASAGNPAINVIGDMTFATNAHYTKGSGITTFKKGGGGTQTLTSNGSDSDLGIVQVSANSGATTLNLGSNVTVTTLTIDASQTLSFTGTSGLGITGTGTAGSRPFINNGIFTQGTGNVTYRGDGDTTIETTNVTYYTLALFVTPTSNRVFTPNGALTVGGDLNVFSVIGSANLKLLLGGNTTVSGAIGIAHAVSGTATFDTSGSNYSLTTGSLAIYDSGSTFLANGSTITLTGTSFTNQGTFTAGTSTLVLSNSGITTFVSTVSTTFNNLTDTTAGSTLKFTNDAGGSTPLYTFAGTVTITGAVGNHITITSDNQPTNKWMAHFNNATSTITHVTVSYSDCDGTSQNVTLDSDSTDGTNNGSCWVFASAGITISGTIYSDDGSSVYNCSTGNVSVAVALNSTLKSPVTCTAAGGTFTLPAVSGAAAGDAIHVFIDNATASKRGSVVTHVVNGSSGITLNVYQQRLIVRDEDGTTMTNSTTKGLGSYDADNNANIIYTSNSNALSLSAGKLLVWTGKTFTPGGTVTTPASSTQANPDGDITIQSSATLTMGTNALSVGGDFTNSGTLSVTSAQTTTFTATSTGFTITRGTGQFDAMTFNGSGGEWTLQDSSSPTGNVTVTAGTLKIGSTTFAISSSKVLNVGASGIFHNGSGTLTINGSGTAGSRPFINAGTFTGSTGLVDYVGDGDTTIETAGATYNNVHFAPSATSNRVYTANGALTVNGGLIVNNQNFNGGTDAKLVLGGNSTIGTISLNYGGGTETSSLDTSGSNYNITTATLNIGGHSTFLANGSSVTITGSGTPFVKSGTFTAGTSTFIYTGTSATDVTVATYNNLTINAASGNPTFTLAGNVSPTGNVNVTAGTLTVATRTLNIAVGKQITVGASGILHNGSGTIAINGTGTAGSRPFINAGTFTGSAGTVVYNGDGDTSIETTSVTYNNLTLTPAISTSNRVYTPIGALNVSGNLTNSPTGTMRLKLSLNGTTVVGGATTISANGSAFGSLDTTASNYAFTTSTFTGSTPGSINIWANASTITITGTGTPFTSDGYSLNDANSTVVYTSSSNTTISDLTYSNLSLMPGSGSPTYTLLNNVGGFAVNDFTLGDGTHAVTVTAATNNPAINIGGNLTINASVTYTKGSGTTTLKPTGTKTWTDSTAGQDMGTVVIGSGSSTPKINLGSNVKATKLTINVSHELSLNGSNFLTLTGTGTAGSRPFINSGTFTGSTGTVEYTGNGSTAVDDFTTYYNLLIDPAIGSTVSYSEGNSTLNVTNNFTINPSSGGANELQFFTGTTVNVTGTMTLNGSGSAHTTMYDDASTYNLGAVNIACATCTFIFDSATMNLASSGTPLTITGTLSNLSSSTIVFTGTSATTIPALPVSVTGMRANVTISPASGSPTYTLASGTTNMNNLTIGDGSHAVTLSATNNPTVNIGGNMTVAASAVYTKGSGTTVFNKHFGGTQTLTDNTAGQDIGAVQISANSGNNTLNLGSSATVTSLTIDSSQIFSNNGSNTLTLTGTGTPLSISGTFTPSTGTIQYTGTTATVTVTTFNNLTLGGTGTYTLPAADVTLRGNMVITSGANVTKSGSNKLIFAIGGGNQTITDSSGNSPDLGIIQVSANGAATTLKLGSNIKATSVIVDSSQFLDANGSNTLTLLGNGTPLTMSGTLTPSTGTIEFASASTSGTTIPAITYYGLKVNKASNTFTPAAGTLTIGGNLDVTAGTLELNTNDPTTSVGGATTITSTLSAPSTGTMTIGGDFINNGTFTHNSGTVALLLTAGLGQLTIGGSVSSSFYNLTASDVANANKLIQVKAGNTLNVIHALVLGGSGGSGNIIMDSDASPTRWTMYVDPTATISITNVVVRNADCGASTKNIGPDNDLFDGGNNNSSCWKFIKRGISFDITQGGGGSGGGGNGNTLPQTFTASDSTGLASYNSNWTVLGGSFDIYSNAVTASGGSYSLAKWTAGNFNDNQYAEMTLSALSSVHYIGVAVRAQSTNSGYIAITDSNNNVAIIKLTSGSASTLYTGTVFAQGDVIRLEISGITLTLKKNGNVITTVDDSTYSTGRPGLGGLTSSTNTKGDNWNAGSLASSGGGGGSGGSSGGGGGTLPQAFTASNGTTLTSYDPNWTIINGQGGFSINSNAVYNTGGGSSFAKWTAGTFNNNQYAQMTLSALSSGNYMGVGVRFQNDISGYVVFADSSGLVIWRYDSGSSNSLYSGSAFSPGDVIRLEISGTTLTLKQNGNVVTTVQDSTYSTGRPALVGLSGSTNSRGDNWDAGSLASQGGGGGGGGGSP